MTLSVGTRLGSYEIIGRIGAGGMGEVYRAQDVKLGREVAIKTLPAALALDADRLARFEREAQLLAALSHANIATIYGLDEHDGTRYLAMELVDGPTLEETLRAGPLPVDDAVGTALQIAQALEAAHGKGVIHRDLKPANVMIGADGVVKVLDFGLAKAFSTETDGEAGNSPALSLAMTQAGLILGTAGYMSPEQASGQAADQRADIWAFGVVLYEMLTGQPVFSGESVPHILADVLKSDPDWRRLPEDLHPRLKLLLERCLRKKPRERYHSIADVRIDLEDVLNDPDGTRAAATLGFSAEALHMGDRGTTMGLGGPRVRGLTLAAAVAVVGVLAGVGAWQLKPLPELQPAPVSRFTFTIPEEHRLRGTLLRTFALAPDGRAFIYLARDALYLRTMDELEPRAVPGTERDIRHLFYSPDGLALAYMEYNTRTLRRIGIAGSASVGVAENLDFDFNGASWSADGTIYYAQPEGIFAVPAVGGSPALVVAAEPPEKLSHPTLLPDGDSLLLGVFTGSDWDNAELVVQSLTTGARKALNLRGNDARYLPTGHIVYAFDDVLLAAPFDLATLTVGGVGVALVEGVHRGAQDGSAAYGIGANGTLAYLQGRASDVARTIVWVDRQGREEPLDLPQRSYVYVRLSPDGTRLALDSRDQESDIWIYDLERAALQRLTFDSGVNRVPVWSPDGERVLFSREIGGTEEIYWQAADGSGAPEPLTRNTGQPASANDMTPDGRFLIYNGNDTPRDIWMIPVGEPDAERIGLIAGSASEENAQLSPDGRWIAYQSTESGNPEVYVRPFPAVDSGRWQISTAGGGRPLWSRDGSELFYQAIDGQPYRNTDGRSVSIMAVAIQSEPDFRPGRPVKLFEGEFASPNSGGGSYDVSLDGQRFLLIRNVNRAGEADAVVIVENWFEELQRLVPTD